MYVKTGQETSMFLFHDFSALKFSLKILQTQPSESTAACNLKHWSDCLFVAVGTDLRASLMLDKGSKPRPQCHATL